MNTAASEVAVAGGSAAFAFQTSFVAALASGLGLAWATFIAIALAAIVGALVAISFDDSIGGSLKRVVIYIIRGVALSLVCTNAAAWALEKYTSLPYIAGLFLIPAIVAGFQQKLWNLANKRIEAEGGKS
jgi:uncharacterized membrane protein AbrB (regulator of aidB expression)